MFPQNEPPPALRGFQILKSLGKGGAGLVFLAQSKGGRLVAIKVLSDAKTHDPEFAEALSREASLCARLTHPSIVQVRAFIEEEGFFALVFEYIKGVALARVLRFCAQRNARLPDRAAWHIVERVLSALSYAHLQRDELQQPAPIVHRDVSPSNVLLDWTGDVKLTDFGMAKMLGVSPSTRLGLVKGTLGCMAPEQARGEPVTERADVYAAALLGWHLATGHAPFAKFKHDELELLRAMRLPRLPSLHYLRPDLPEPLLAAIELALSPDQNTRKITAEQLAKTVKASVDVARGREELESLLAGARSVLERTVVRGEGSSISVEGSDQNAAHTLRYEEVALAFDDETEDPYGGGISSAHGELNALLPLGSDVKESAPLASPRVALDRDPKKGKRQNPRYARNILLFAVVLFMMAMCVWIGVHLP